MDGSRGEGGEELVGVAVELHYLSAVIVKYLEGFGELDDPVINRNCRLNLRFLQVVGEVADVTVISRFCAAVAVWL